MAIITKTFTTPESTSSNHNITVDLPKLKELISVTVNTGTVAYEPVAGNTEQLKVNCRSGSWSRRSLEEGYSPRRTKNVSNVDGGYSDRRGIWEWTGSRWEHKETVNAPGNVDPPGRIWYEDGQGYEGWISNTIRVESYDNRNYQVPPPNPRVGDTYTKVRIITDYYYGGEVVRPGYWYDYYEYYYQYVITVTYKETGFEWLIRVNNALRTASVGWVKVDEQLRKIDTAHIKINGELKEV